MSTDEQRKEAFDALELAIEKIVALDDDRAGEIACDAVLLIGMQYVDDDGDRGGYVNIIPRHGWQPGYITAGLLTMAKARVVEPLPIPIIRDDE